MPSDNPFHPDYVVVRELGRGGGGVVYLARHRVLDRLEVLKVPSPEVLRRPGMRERFLREMQLAARLNHPNVVTAYGVVTLPAGPALAMEYVDGPDLFKLVAEGERLSVTRACGYAVHICRGLGHAHDLGLVHRDIKPANLMVATVGGKPVVKILDFGMAKAASEDAAGVGLTAYGDVLGTPDFMAPEQAAAASAADTRADLYAVGCCLYFLLAGRPPFPRPSLVATLEAHRSEPPPPLHQFRDDLPEGLAAVVARLLAKRPGDRYPTPQAAEEALSPFGRRTTTGSGTKPALVLHRPVTIVGGASRLPVPARSAYLNAEDFAATGKPTPPKKKGTRAADPPAWLTPAIIGGAAFFALAAVIGIGLLVVLSPTAPPQRLATDTTSEPAVAAPPVAPPVGGTAAMPSPSRMPADWLPPQFRPLFDGGDLAGWRTEAGNPGRWKVDGGVLVGRASKDTLLVYEQSVFNDVHVKARVRVAAGGNGGLCVRCPADATGGGGYVAQINAVETNPAKTGSLFREQFLTVPVRQPARVDGWFDLDLIAVGDRVVVKVGGQTTAMYTDPARKYGGGRVALQASSDVPVEFAAVAVRELPPAAAPADEPAAPPDLTARINGTKLQFSYDPTQTGKGRWTDCRLDDRTGVYPVGVEPRAVHLRPGRRLTFGALVVDCPAQPPPGGYRLFVFKTGNDTVPVLLTAAQAFALPRGTWPAKLRVLAEGDRRVVTFIKPLP